MITHWTRKSFERVFNTDQSLILDMKLVYDVAHNIAKVENHKIRWRTNKSVVVHRKGATTSISSKFGRSSFSKYRDLGSTSFSTRVNGNWKLDFT